MIAWNPDRPLPPAEALVEHPELARYHRGWGRPGDLGIVAEVDGEYVGLIFCRLFTDEDHGHGYVDSATPELGIAVVDGFRGLGIGTLLMESLKAQAKELGVPALSLSVDADNPARRLYQRLGYHEVSRDGSGIRMILHLD